jgi:hypothetical protein
MAYTLADFEKMFGRNGLHVTSCFGDYDLRPFDVLSSPRLILIANTTL